jgi:hypothetical protein
MSNKEKQPTKEAIKQKSSQWPNEQNQQRVMNRRQNSQKTVNDSNQ